VRQTNNQVEFGDFQTPYALALAICERLRASGLVPDVIIEPSCGLGSFVLASIKTFHDANTIVAADINEEYLKGLRRELDATSPPTLPRVLLQHRDYFQTNWNLELEQHSGNALVIGNFPWVTNSTQGRINGTNLPSKSNFLKMAGIDAITGKSNFDISEWMLIDVMGWLAGREAALAMLCKSAVARKILAHAEDRRMPIVAASLTRIDAMRHFGAAVDACLLFLKFSSTAKHSYDYTVYENLGSTAGTRMGARMGMAVSDIESFTAHRQLIGDSPVRWRSGVKHDAVEIMELIDVGGRRENIRGDRVNIEDTYLYPMVKGTGLNKGRVSDTNRYMIVPQRTVGEATDVIERRAPQTWAYLMGHIDELQQRKSRIYRANPRFSVFGVGEYTFKPWKIALSALHKSLSFRIVGPSNGKPVVFDDTVYFVGFDVEEEAMEAYAHLTSPRVLSCLKSLIFWDDKRPIKAHVLNRVDWSQLDESATPGNANA
jgi:hypothetical protein